MRITFIGAGNLATHLAPALQQAGHQVVQVYSRTEQSAAALAQLVQCAPTNQISQLVPDVDAFFFSVSDAALPDLAARLYAHLRQIARPGNPRQGAGSLFVHTAGSMPLSTLPTLRRGVFYPMQTFSKSRPVDFRQIPIFLESTTDMPLLQSLAHDVSSVVYEMDGERRRHLHVAAVFACNFVNHMYDLSARLLQQQDIPFEVMLPLIDETASKVHALPPRQAQTGPAVRYDTNVMDRHLQLLSADPSMQELYRLISRSIHDKL